MLGVSARPVVAQGHRPGRRAGWPGPASPPTWSRSPARSVRSPARSSSSGPGTCSGAPFVVTFFVLLDMLDGALARARGGGSVFGAVLDSVGDRAADAAIFGALIWWFSGRRRQPAAGPARAAVPRARRADLLHQGAGRGGRPLLRRRHRRAHSSGCCWCSSAPGSPGSGCRTRCTSGSGSCSSAAPSRSASASSPSTGPRPAPRCLPRRPSRDRERAVPPRPPGPPTPASPPGGTPSGCCRSPRHGACSTGPGAGRPAGTGRAPASCGPTSGSSPAGG